MVYTPTYFLFTCLLTPWSRVLLDKLTGFQIVTKLLAFYGTRRFITAFTSARHLSLYWASSIQSIPQFPLLEDPVLYAIQTNISLQTMNLQATLKITENVQFYLLWRWWKRNHRPVGFL